MKKRSDAFSQNIAAKQSGKELPDGKKVRVGIKFLIFPLIIFSIFFQAGLKEDNKIPVSPWILGLFLFLVVGSALF